VARYPIGRRRALVLLALTCVLLISLDLQGNVVTRKAREFFVTAFRPLEDGARVATRPFQNAWRGIRDYDSLQAENQDLRDLIAQQEGAFINAIAQARDALELKALNGVETPANIDTVTAKVVGASPSNFSQSVEIDRGRNDGLRVGMPVVDTAGLVGKVTDVFPDRAIVLLVTDPLYRVEVKVVNPPPEVPAPGESTTTSSLPFGATTLSTTSTTAPPSAVPGVTTVPPTSGPSLAPPPGQTTVPPDSTAPSTTAAPTTAAPTTTTLAPLGPIEKGIMAGQGPGNDPSIRFVDEFFGAAQVAASVVTAGGASSLAPEGITVGLVSRVLEGTASSGPRLEVRPAASLGSLNFVRVLLYQSAPEAGG